VLYLSTGFLYNFNKKANIKIVLIIIVVFLFALLIFPIFLKINFSFLGQEKRLYFRFDIFGIKINVGFIDFYSDHLEILHRNKTKIFYYKDTINVKDKVKPLRDYHVKKSVFYVECGDKNYGVYSYFFGFLINFISNFIGVHLNNKKPYVNFGVNYLVKNDDECFNVYGKTTIIFNLLMVVLSFIKIIIGKCFNEKTKRKQNQFNYTERA